MILASLLALAPVAALQEPTTIATYKLAGKDVAVTLPARGEVSSTAPIVSLGDWNYLLDAQGTPVAKMRGQGGWSEVATLYSEAKAKWTPQTPTWHVKVILFTRTDILDKTPDGVLRQRRAYLGRNSTDAVLQDVGRFCVAAEAAAGGTARVVADVEVDSDLLLGDANSGEGKVFGEDFVRRTATARTNAGGYEAEDKIYRGPYESVFVLHPGLTPGLVRTRAWGAPVSSFSVYDARWLSSPAVPESLLSCWAADLSEKLSRTPQMRVPLQDVTRAMSSAMSVAPYLASMPKELPARMATQKPWTEVSANPLAGLPRIKAPSGASSTMSVATEQGVPLLLTPVALADLVAASLPDATAVGWSVIEGVPVLTFRPSGALSDKPIEALNLTSKVKNAEQLAAGITLNSDLLSPTGNFVTKIEDDAQRGRMLTVTEVGDVRNGHGVLPTEGEAKGSVLRFDVKTTSKDPISVVVLGSKGPVEIQLGTPDPAASDYNTDVSTTTFPLKSDGNWQTIQVNLEGKAEPGSLLLIAPPSSSRYYERRQLDPNVYTFAKAAWQAAADGQISTPASDSSELQTRALTVTKADTKTLLTMIDDRNDTVAMNVAARFQKIKSAEAEPGLIKLAASANPRVSQQAVLALQFQGTESAKTALRNILDNGVYETDRMFAAEAIAAENLPNSTGAISRLLAVPSWQAKVRALDLISKLASGDPDKAMMITFLLQDSPEVRLRATQLADPAFDLACRRLLYGAVNDSSDAVRAASYVQLLKSPTAKYREEGRKGIGDDSAAVRLIVLQALTEKPTEAERAVLQQAVTDKSPELRAEALRGFAKIPGNVQAEEFANTFKDTNPEVQLALVQLAISKKVSLPVEVVKELKSSPNAEVAEAAKALPG